MYILLNPQDLSATEEILGKEKCAPQKLNATPTDAFLIITFLRNTKQKLTKRGSFEGTGCQ